MNFPIFFMHRPRFERSFYNCHGKFVALCESLTCYRWQSLGLGRHRKYIFYLLSVTKVPYLLFCSLTIVSVYLPRAHKMEDEILA